ncbi:PhzF family phenazine biosynthesis isomerase [Cellulomonas sp. JZ18]|uniref:PhzF family phenazine biosynthesis protein n=1 Tax=Cellulomonas sp. JZ18 TaxID=2654191 RepID=UPI0012D466A3|nr:PhzF family phenazine biosynthesis isomerase [Cellulomonas sp. JZ18]QGQ20189.1 PhzF family phenazine biosynthesis isomerase [Cellulomonas sp. JZ18]
MSDLDDVQRWAAFAAEPGGGNPAGVVLDARGWSDERMRAVAAEVGYAETAFVTDPGTLTLRYFSPVAEVPFCGHATVATAVALAAARGPGDLLLRTPVGPVAVTTRDAGGVLSASFTSVEPRVADLDPAVLDELLGLLGLTRDDLDPTHPPRTADAGNVHPVVVLRDAAAFDAFGFDPAAVRALMDREGWAGTVTVLHRRGDDEYEARNLFPVGTLTEDPATGSAAAATGAYLRALGLLAPPARVRVHQGRHVGRPSVLVVDVPEAGGVTVTGTAARI